MSTIVVHSTLPAPVALRCFRLINDETGTPCSRVVAGPIVLKPGRNEVDDQFWAAWHEQHRDTLLAAHLAVEEEPPRPLP